MAVLSTAQRDAVARAFMRITTTEPTPYLKSVVRTTVDNVDDWTESAATAVPATSYNAALTTAFRNNATAAQKALMLSLVCHARAGRPLPEGQ